MSLPALDALRNLDTIPQRIQIARAQRNSFPPPSQTRRAQKRNQVFALVAFIRKKLQLLYRDMHLARLNAPGELHTSRRVLTNHLILNRHAQNSRKNVIRIPCP